MDVRSDDEIRADLSYLLNKASQALDARVHDTLADVDLQPRSFCVLTKAVAGDKTQREVADMALLDKTTMTIALDGLERAGLARRVPSPTDRRAHLVQATDEGVQLAEKSKAAVHGLYDDVLGALPPAQREALLDALVALVRPGGALNRPTPSQG